MIEDLKNQIQLFEIATDKILYNNPYIVKKTQNIKIIDNYKPIFETENEVQENKEQSVEEQIKLLRDMKRGG